MYKAVKNVVDNFNDAFETNAALIVRSPGRVNIIGEHLDYNEGYVLPAAIDMAIYVAVNKRSDAQIHLYSVDFKEKYKVAVAAIAPTKTWATYILGVADQLIKRGYNIGGFNLALDGDVPIGAGLSSSAAVECATVFALNNLFKLGIDKMEMVCIAQKAEQTFSGVMCGVMDMFASMFGKKDYVIKLDCKTLAYEYKPFVLDGYKIVLLNTNVKHSHSSSAYNERRKQCEQGVAWVKQYRKEVNSLRDVTMEMLDKYVVSQDAIIYNRCKYVVEEMQRLLNGCKDLEDGNIEALGEKMFATHEGLSILYEVSCKEADWLVAQVKNNSAVLGARMMGGGFGGCTINIIKEEAINELVEKLSREYREKMGLELSAYISSIENGTGEVSIS